MIQSFVPAFLAVWRHLFELIVNHKLKIVNMKLQAGKL